MSEKLLRFLAEGKLLVTVISQLFAFLLVWNSKITPDVYLTLAVAVPIAFITGSVLGDKINTISVK
jgi:hypothetical protein